MSIKAGALLWNRQRIFIPLSIVPYRVGTGLTQVNKSFADMSPNEPGFGDPSRIQVIPLAPTANWASISHGEPFLGANGEIIVLFSNSGTPVEINVLFWDPHSILGPGQADTYG
jgi:hypothetical protein